MKNSTLFVLIILCCFLENNALYAQDSTEISQLYYLRVRFKKEYVGTVLKQDKHETLLSIPGQENLLILNRAIKYVEQVNPDNFFNGEYWPEYKAYFHHPHVPTAFPGKNYGQLGLFTGFSAGAGFKNNISVSLGFNFFLIAESAGIKYGWISPKFSIPLKSKNIHIAVGYFGGKRLEIVDKNVFIGFPYVVSTLGNHNINGTVGIGYGKEAGQSMHKPIYFGAALSRINKLHFVSIEMMYLGAFGHHLTMSFRKQNTKNTIDLGIISFTNGEFYSKTSQLFSPFLKLTAPIYKPSNFGYH